MVSHASSPLLQSTTSVHDLGPFASITGASFPGGISLGCLVEEGLCQGAAGRGHFCRTP